MKQKIETILQLMHLNADDSNALTPRSPGVWISVYEGVYEVRVAGKATGDEFFAEAPTLDAAVDIVYLAILKTLNERKARADRLIALWKSIQKEGG